MKYNTHVCHACEHVSQPSAFYLIWLIFALLTQFSFRRQKHNTGIDSVAVGAFKNAQEDTSTRSDIHYGTNFACYSVDPTRSYRPKCVKRTDRPIRPGSLAEIKAKHFRWLQGQKRNIADDSWIGVPKKNGVVREQSWTTRIGNNSFHSLRSGRICGQGSQTRRLTQFERRTFSRHRRTSVSAVSTPTKSGR